MWLVSRVNNSNFFYIYKTIFCNAYIYASVISSNSIHLTIVMYIGAVS